MSGELTTAATVRSRPRTTPTILVVDDNSATRRFVRETLAVEGYQVAEAAGGAEALEWCAETLPDLVIIDLCMGDMRGLDVVARLRTSEHAAALPVIVFTGAPEEVPEPEVGVTPLFDDLIAKPAEPAVLLDAVRSHLGTEVTPAPLVTGPPPRAVVADGDTARALRTRLHLRRLGFDVVLAATAADALVAARTEPPTLLVADLVLPDSTALELTRLVRSDPDLAAVPIVLTSVAPWSRIQERLAERAGATAFVTVASDLSPLRKAVLAAASAEVPPGVPTTEEAAAERHAERLLRELHRQYHERQHRARSAERSRAELAVLQGLAELLAEAHDLDRVLHEGLSRCLHAIGASRGAVLLAEIDGGHSQRAHVGDLVLTVEEDVFRRVAETSDTLVVGASTIVTPLASAGDHFGVLVVEVPAHEDLRFWTHFLKLVGLGLGMAVASVRGLTSVRMPVPDRHHDDTPYRDGLTGLANTARLEMELGRILATGASGGRGALFVLDVDRLRQINDALGHSTGDELLRGLARVLRSVALPGSTVARLHSDVFALLVPGVDGAEAAGAMARRILSALEAPIHCNGYTLYATVSVGVALYPDHAGRAPELLQHAHTAMDAAHEVGGNRFEVYTPDSGSALWERLTVDQGLRAALERDEFTMHYQPIVDLFTDEIVGGEALLRWDRPLHGMTPAGSFLQIAEETGLIVSIGAWVLGAVATQVRQWESAAPQLERVSVNVGARELHEGDVFGTLVAAVEATGVDPSLLCLEVTETVALADLDRAVEVLEKVRGLGVVVALDDFGTGYSSLRYVQDLPLDALKIDRSFVAAAAQGERARPILASMIGMAHDLGLSVVAEGIETERCLELVRSLGCDHAQGWHVGHPAPPQEFAATLFRA